MKLKLMPYLALIFTLILSGCSTVKKIDFPEINLPVEAFELPVESHTIQPDGEAEEEIFTRSTTLQRQGIDTLAAAQYGANLSAIPYKYCIGGFAKTFGDFFPVAKKELDAGRECIRVNLLWSDSHTYGDKDLKFITSESKRYEILCKANPGRLIEIAPFTEHNLKNPDKFLSVVKANAPNCGKPVNSAWKGAYTKNPQFKNEVHGSHGKPPAGVGYNYSYDGTNSVDSDVASMLAKHRSAEIFYLWHPRLNLKWSMKDTTPRPQRKAKASPDLLRSLVYLYTEKLTVLLPKGWMVKSHAEKHGPADAKGDKLLIISPVKKLNKKGKPYPIILKRNGKKTGQLDYYGTFEGGGFRYYAPQMGFKYGPNTEIWIAGKKYGVINPGFRTKPFRD